MGKNHKNQSETTGIENCPNDIRISIYEFVLFAYCMSSWLNEVLLFPSWWSPDIHACPNVNKLVHIDIACTRHLISSRGPPALQRLIERRFPRYWVSASVNQRQLRTRVAFFQWDLQKEKNYRPGPCDFIATPYVFTAGPCLFTGGLPFSPLGLPYLPLGLTWL